jgi:CTP:molybdopterin cytidylyltransferase MocA
MGGPNKLLLPYGGTTVVGAVVQTLLACGLDVVVVTGRDALDVERSVAPARTVFNYEFASGLGSSIAAGVAQVPEQNAVLVALGDMPSLRKDVVGLLVERSARDAIVVPRYLETPDVPGHPVLFGQLFRTALLQLKGDKGARAVIETDPTRVVTLDVPGALVDVDQPGDLP